jgi:hypothetical protein
LGWSRPVISCRTNDDDDDDDEFRELVISAFPYNCIYEACPGSKF